MRYTEPYTIFARTLPSGKTVYYYRVRNLDGSISVAKSTGCTELAKAKRYCQKLYNSGAFSITHFVTFRDYTAHFFDDNSKYLKWKKSNGHELEPNTVDSYRCKLKYQLLPFFANYDMDKITKDIVKQWVVWATDKWSPKTVNNAQGVLSIIFNQAKDENLIITSPVDGVQYRPRKKIKRELLTIEEIRQIYNLKWSSETQRKAFLLACLTGMREGEICSLTAKDKKQDKDGYCYLDVHTSNKKHGVGSTKTDVNRIVPIPRKIYEMLSGDNWLFEYKGEPMPPHNLYNSFIRKCQKIGIDTKARKITFHTLRNFFTSYLERYSVVQYKIDAVTGHADKTMTDWYTYWSADMFIEVYNSQEKLLGEILCDYQ